MSQEVYAYNGFGIDLGTLEPKFSNDTKENQACQNIFDSFIDDPDDVFGDNDLYWCLDDTDANDVTIDTHPDSETYDFLMLIENAYVVGEEPVKMYTEDEAKKHLAKAFNRLFDQWCKACSKDNKLRKLVANKQQIEAIKQAVDQEIIKNADYDYNAGPWYNIA